MVDAVNSSPTSSSSSSSSPSLFSSSSAGKREGSPRSRARCVGGGEERCGLLAIATVGPGVAGRSKKVPDGVVLLFSLSSSYPSSRILLLVSCISLL